jgi:hypothetical protein
VKESLKSENIPDPMEGEQTWPTEEELAEAEEESRVLKRRVKKVPKGMSEYQAAWIPDSDAGMIKCYVKWIYLVPARSNLEPWFSHNYSIFPCQYQENPIEVYYRTAHYTSWRAA